MSDPGIELLTNWSDADFAAFSRVMTRQADASDWTDRWSTGQEYYRWKFAGNPAGTAIAAVVRLGDEIVGCCSLTPRLAWYDGQPIRAAELGDLYTDPSQRGQGVFRRLVNSLEDEMRRRKFDFVYCMPNKGGGEALCAVGDFSFFPAGDIRLIGVPLVPSSFAPSSVRAVCRLAIDLPLAGFRSLSSNSGELDLVEGVSIEDLQLVGGSGSRFTFDDSVFDAGYRVANHPDRASYSMLQDQAQDRGWAVIRRTRFRGHPTILVGKLEAASPKARGKLFKRIAAWAARNGNHAVFAWAPVDRTFEYIGLSGPAIPLSRKRCVVANTEFVALVQSAQGSVPMQMINTDKI